MTRAHRTRRLAAAVDRALRAIHATGSTAASPRTPARASKRRRSARP